jgi:hypothetical protein
MNSPRNPLKPRQPIIFVFVMLAVVFGVALFAKLAAGQETGESPVVYRECYRPPVGNTFGRFPECGIDEQATEELRRQIEDSTRPLTPEEDEQVETYIDDEYGDQLADKRRDELLSVFNTAGERIAALLASDALSFSDEERQFLRLQSEWFEEQSRHFSLQPSDTREIQEARAEIGEVLRRVHEIVLARQREAAATVPDIENIVTRIDALVARVGTVIRDLEREGLVVPRSVRDGHAVALTLVRESKRTCATHRPAGCRTLREVLNTIEAMREPLCDLPSDLLTFCN